MVAEEARHLLLYEYVADIAERRAPHRERHLEKLAAEREAGHITMAGPFDPPTGAAIVFEGVAREHVEAFAAADPYMEAGLITSWRVQRWTVV